MATAYIQHPDCLKHEMGTGHPESPARLQAIDDQLIASGLMDLLRHHEAPLATREAILRVHEPDYLRALEASLPEVGYVELDPDTRMNPHSLQAAYRAAGAGLLGTDLVLDGEAENAFCAVRPPGHHAEAGRAMGFCLFNNIAIAVRHALEVHGLQRVAIVDFDVHHGNGTETILREDERVLFCSSFQHPFYPHTPLIEQHPRLIHVPLPAGSGSQAFREGIVQKWLPALEAFRPQLIFVSAGFDGHVEDEMSSLQLRDDDYAWVSALICEQARQHADGRVVSLLEGGYALHALGRSVALHLRALLGVDSW